MKRYEIVVDDEGNYCGLIPSENGSVVKLADAQATVEALQRERDDAVLLRDHNLRRCEALDSKYKKVLADLDAERERYELLNVERNAIDDKRHVLHEQLANTIEAAARQEGELAEIQALAANLKSQLSQLKALVRDFIEAWDHDGDRLNRPRVRAIDGGVSRGHGEVVRMSARDENMKQIEELCQQVEALQRELEDERVRREQVSRDVLRYVDQQAALDGGKGVQGGEL